MHPHAYDRYAFLLPLCGTVAFRLPPPIPGPRPLPADDHPNLLGTIPDNLLGQYLCFEPSPPPPSTTAAAPLLPHLPTRAPAPPPLQFTDSIVHNSSSGPLLHDPPRSCQFSNLHCSNSEQGHPDFHDDVVNEESQRPENLPLCVVNRQVSLPSTPEGERFSAAVGHGDLCDEGPVLLLCEIKELALWHEDYGLEDNDTEPIVSVMTMFRNLAFAVGYSERLLYQIKELALHGCVVLDDNDVKHMVSLVTKFRNLAFFTGGRNNSGCESDLPELSKKKQRRESEVKSNTVVSLNYFTRCKPSNADAANCTAIDLDDCRPAKRKFKGKVKGKVKGKMKKPQVDLLI